MLLPTAISVLNFFFLMFKEATSAFFRWSVHHNISLDLKQDNSYGQLLLQNFSLVWLILRDLHGSFPILASPSPTFLSQDVSSCSPIDIFYPKLVSIYL